MVNQRRPLLKSEIELIQKQTKSAAQAARMLGVSYKTYRKYAQMYGIFHTNKSGKGIKKIMRRGSFGLQEILEGKHPNYSKARLRERLIRAGIFPNECSTCGYNSTRPNGMAPLDLYQKDGDSKNFKLDNLELRCYNCMFLTTGKIKIYEEDPSVYENDLREREKMENSDSSMLDELNNIDMWQKGIQEELEKELKNINP